MRLDVGPLLKEPIDAQVDIEFNLGFQRLSDDVDVASIRGMLNLWRTTEGIWARGSFEVDVDLQCVRCLAPVAKTLDVELDERFQLLPAGASDEGEVYPIDANHHIDLEPILRELVILATPMRVLCQTECRGICPICGKDLNEGACDCEPDDIDPRMAALQSLLT
jgi:uncharacterized protein